MMDSSWLAIADANPRPASTQKKAAPEGAAQYRLLRGLEAAAATAAATTTEVATRGAALALLGFIDLQRTTTEVFAIERLHGAGGIGIRHFDETETARAAGLAIVHERHLVDGAVGCKEGAHLIFGGRERQISNVKFRHGITHKNIEQMTGQALSAGSRILWGAVH